MAEIHHPGRIQPPRGLSPLAAALFLIALICGFYWKLTLSSKFTWLTGADTTSQVLPWLQLQARELHSGRIPLWDPYSWLGQPLIGQAQPGVAYPLNWLLYAMPLRDGFIKTGWLNWYFVVIHLMAAWFAYLLARDLRLSRAAAVFAGSAFTLLGWMGETEWPQMLNGAVWAPLVLLFVFRICRGVRIWHSALYGGIALGMSWLSGHHQAPIFLSLAAGSILAWNALTRKHWKLLAASALLFVAALCAGAVQILPAYEYGKHSVRWVGRPDPIGWDQKVPWHLHREWRTSPADLLGIVLPGMHTHASPYLGAATLTLALLGFWTCRRRREARWLASIAAAALLFSMVDSSPLHGILYSLVPLVEKARNPSAAVYLTGLAAALLAAMALDRLRRDAASTARAAKLLCWFACAIFALRAGWAIVNDVKGLGSDRVLVNALCALALALLLSTARRRAVSLTAAAVCACLIVSVEASNENSYFMPALTEEDRVAPLTALSEHNDIADFLRAQPGFPRTVTNEDEIRYNFGAWHGVHSSAGYLASLTRNATQMGLESSEGQRLRGIAFAVRTQPAGNHTELVFTGKSGLNVFRDPSALPRAFAVHEILHWLPGHNAMMMNDHFKDRFGHAAFVDSPAPTVEACPGRPSHIRILSHLPSQVRIHADMGCRGLVILSDTFFPGWKASIDGVETPILQAHGGLRAAVVPQGKHDVVMAYRPLSVISGAFLSLAALLCAAVFALRGLGERRSKQ
ncbi:MAG: hypothetical protein C0504_20040 [Candidatus Solibacter sp.]|nr:hypothetical protein [Candidatus Solibacter sp.]